MAEDPSQSFFAQAGKLTFAELPPTRHIQSKLKFGVSEDLPDTLKTKYSLIRSDFQASPDRKVLKPSFNFNEITDAKEIFDFSSAKPTSTFDMLNVYRLDLKLKSPFFKEYRRVLDSGGFAKKGGMCAAIAELKAVGRAPNGASLKQNKKYRSHPTVSSSPALRSPSPEQTSFPLLKSYAMRTAKRTKQRSKLEGNDVEDTRVSIDRFEQALKHSLMEEVQTQFFVRDYRQTRS